MQTRMPLGARVVALTALLWNLFGLLIFVLQVSMTPEQVAALPRAQQQINAAMPLWIYAVFGVATIAGTAGSVALLSARRWAEPMLRVSLVAVVVQMAASYALTPVWSLTGLRGLGLPLLLVLVVAAVWLFARGAARRGWLR
ncbi:conserved membrane hypothetical protein [Luteimonas sp. 9C]|uniref:hypothetical protein n=1 Tax=Luteimonas sp. 9C TaxID=2653148 RepID=UPI0012F3E05A|nr:hypothetical protein [Luteimonas sp. 9C]VXC04662.1 conserved membrane hypothetical protein [Luteimonas sp. 9C]